MLLTNLQAFGEKLQELRRAAGFTQEALADQLCAIHARSKPRAELGLDGNRISKWERAFFDNKGRIWKPTRQHVLSLIELFADQMTPEDARAWATQAGYRLRREEVQPLFAAPSPPDLSPALKDGAEPWLLLPEQRLFGVGSKQQQLLRTLGQHAAPWLIAVDGIGGIGKTSLAVAAVREIISTQRFAGLIWVSAKPESYLVTDPALPSPQPALDRDSLLSAMLAHFDHEPLLSSSFDAKVRTLAKLLKQRSYLVVIDNLETVVDYETLLPLLRQLSKPSKFLLTSRHSLYAQTDVYSLHLNELSQADTSAFLRSEAEGRGVTDLSSASAAQLDQIYQVVGGNPLALKLLVGQACVLTLSQVLENLKAAQGKTVDDLYTYIYWQAWHLLDGAAQQVLLLMPLAQGGTLEQLQALTPLSMGQLGQVLQQLATLSLVQIGGNLERRRYTIHRLTETFLLNKAIEWNKLT